MPKKRVFISYSHKDEQAAVDIQSALEAAGVATWRDAVSIEPGAVWSRSIEDALRAARAVVVLISRSSTRKSWVVYEYAVASTLGHPVIGLLIDGAAPPSALSRYQMIRMTAPETAAADVRRALASSATPPQRVPMTPRLMAKFVEMNGELEWAKDGESVCMELWLEDVPRQTTSVYFEILDEGFRSSRWRLKRNKGAREFLTDDMNSWGDVEIAMRGERAGKGTWVAQSSLYDALARYYKGRRMTREARKALKQIKDC